MRNFINVANNATFSESIEIKRYREKFITVPPNNQVEYQ